MFYGKHSVAYFNIINMKHENKHTQKGNKKMKTYSKTINVSTGHELSINSCESTDLPGCPHNYAGYNKFYKVQNWDKNGVVFFYIAKGDYYKNEIHVFYGNGNMWTSFGKNFKEAIEGAIQDGWMYTKPEFAK